MKEPSPEQLEIKDMIDELKNRKKDLSRDAFEIVCNISDHFKKSGAVNKKELQTLKNLIDCFR